MKAHMYHSGQMISFMSTPKKQLFVAADDMCEPRSETSTTCHSDDDREDIVVGRDCCLQGQSLAKISQPTARPTNLKLKNELCRNYLQQGYCPYNEKCQFAHGTAELRQNKDHNAKYKTKKCISFFRDMHCMYGERCNFLHQQPYIPHQNKWKPIYRNYRQLMAQTRNESRLFPLTN